ncbi:MAG: hypothetical protein BMS9Abin37_3053 [Acidobacteriota bacterium]|nr:MAG: hypothetical protein BMS9Abin37_3053 [Acidobacteriota bacterium]
MGCSSRISSRFSSVRCLASSTMPLRCRRPSLSIVSNTGCLRDARLSRRSELAPVGCQHVERRSKSSRAKRRACRFSSTCTGALQIVAAVFIGWLRKSCQAKSDLSFCINSVQTESIESRASSSSEDPSRESNPKSDCARVELFVGTDHEPRAPYSHEAGALSPSARNTSRSLIMKFKIAHDAIEAILPTR